MVCVSLFIHLYEEPHLRKIFGEQYLEYCRRVPPLDSPASRRSMTITRGLR